MCAHCCHCLFKIEKKSTSCHERICYPLDLFSIVVSILDSTLQSCVSLGYIIDKLLQHGALSDPLLCELGTQLPDLNRTVCVPHCQELLLVELHTQSALTPGVLLNAGRGSEALLTQIKHLQHTWGTNE